MKTLLMLLMLGLIGCGETVSKKDFEKEMDAINENEKKVYKVAYKAIFNNYIHICEDHYKRTALVCLEEQMAPYTAKKDEFPEIKEIYQACLKKHS